MRTVIYFHILILTNILQSISQVTFSFEDSRDFDSRQDILYYIAVGLDRPLNTYFHFKFLISIAMKYNLAEHFMQAMKIKVNRCNRNVHTTFMFVWIHFLPNVYNRIVFDILKIFLVFPIRPARFIIYFLRQSGRRNNFWRQCTCSAIDYSTLYRVLQT